MLEKALFIVFGLSSWGRGAMDRFGLLHRHLDNSTAATLATSTVLRVSGEVEEVGLLLLHPAYVIFFYIVFLLCAVSSAVVYLVRRRAAGGPGGLQRGLGGPAGPDLPPAYTKLFPEGPPPSYDQVLREVEGDEEGDGLLEDHEEFATS